MRVGALVVLVIVAGCGEPVAVESTKAETDAVALPPPPTIDQSTPDRAMKSWWATREWESAVHAAAEKVERSKPENAARKTLMAAYAKLTSGNLHQSLTDRPVIFTPQTFERDILEVKQETDSRAVVLGKVRNTTPLADESAIPSYSREERANGVVFRYVLERDAGGPWKITDVWQQGKYYPGGWMKLYEPRTSTYIRSPSP